jgi:hypothetical protein
MWALLSVAGFFHGVSQENVTRVNSGATKMSGIIHRADILVASGTARKGS